MPGPMRKTTELPNGPVQRTATTLDQRGEIEFYRLLGYPPNHEVSGRSLERIEQALQWYHSEGDPEIYSRPVSIKEFLEQQIVLETSVTLESRVLARRLRTAGASALVIVALSAGAAVDARCEHLWRSDRPDEAWALERLSAAVVGQLVRFTHARLCQIYEQTGHSVTSHYSPGYTGWELSEQHKLFEILTEGKHSTGSFEILDSGMLRPKNSLLTAFAVTDQGAEPTSGVPCRSCSFTPCAYRRARYRSSQMPEENQPEGTKGFEES